MTIKQLIPKVANFLFVGVLISFFPACNSDDSDNGKVDEVEINERDFLIAINNLTLIDNNINAADIALSISPPSLPEQVTASIIVIAKSTEVDRLDADQLWELSTNSFQTLENFESYHQMQLDATLLDTDGDLLSGDQSYAVGIISEYNLDEKVFHALKLSDTFEFVSFQQGVYNLPVTFSQNAGLDAITINSDGDLLVSNYGSAGNGTEVFKITTFGLIEDFGEALLAPLGSAIDDTGDLYVCKSNSIIKIDPNGNQSLFLNYSSFIAGLAFDNNNNLYATLYSRDEILKIDSQGAVEVFVQHSDLEGSVGIIYYPEEDAFYVSNYDNGKIHKINSEGELTLLVQASGIGYLTEMNDYLYATLFTTHQIARISFTGEVTIIAGKSGDTSQAAGELSEATFHNPNGICADEANNVLYVTDWGSPRVSKVQL